jgi:hypothetical protein
MALSSLTWTLTGVEAVNLKSEPAPSHHMTDKSTATVTTPPSKLRSSSTAVHSALCPSPIAKISPRSVSARPILKATSSTPPIPTSRFWDLVAPTAALHCWGKEEWGCDGGYCWKTCGQNEKEDGFKWCWLADGTDGKGDWTTCEDGPYQCKPRTPRTVRAAIAPPVRAAAAARASLGLYALCGIAYRGQQGLLGLTSLDELPYALLLILYLVASGVYGESG